ncbi:hypothetical protein JOF53_006378 [Crossiella equi]|uniref:Peptidase S1 domain-containing protein n=1 Tax=Crossiella equi TaxID=130796 RepID=A0ABS5ALT3_9PSEU|nr:AbfB domain-containing protein [Crossiella equi]MBP2477506.1 hypothetical protein [Crossiella equi]
MLASGLAAAVASGLLVAAPAHAIGNGTPAGAGEHAYTALVKVGTKSCSGVLVDPQWILTAASCFGDNVQPGKPAQRTVVTVGRTRLSEGNGDVVEVAHITPRADRNLVAARLVEPAADVPSATLGTGGFGAGEQLTVAGFGALAEPGPDEDLLHLGGFTLGTQTQVAITLVPGSSVCAGDVGGPVLRQRNGRVELAAVVTGSPSRGCHGETETGGPTTAARTDDLGPWLADLVRAGREVPGAANSSLVQLRNRISGLCLVGQATLGECGTAAASQWETVGTGETRVLRNLATRSCLGVAGDEVASQACSGADFQNWRVTPGETGAVLLTNAASGRAATVSGIAPGSKPVQRTGQPYAYQQWELVAKGKARHDLATPASLAASNAGLPNHYLRHARGEGWLSLITASSPDLDKADATFRLVPGLADGNCYSIEATNYPRNFLRHANGRLRLDAYDPSGLFAADATWCAKDAENGRGVAFASWNFPDNHIRHIRGEVWNAYKGGAQWYETPVSYEDDTSWLVTPPLKP